MPTSRRETLAFVAALTALLAALLGESLFGGKILSPADVLFVQESFAEYGGPSYEPVNRLLIDPVLQFQPWLEFNRTMLRQGRLPLWNGLAGFGAPHLANGQSAVFDPFHLIAYLGRLPGAYAWMAAARLWVAGLGMYLLARRWGLGRWGRWFAGLAFPLCGFLVVWLLFPVTSTAVWLPWLFLATDALFDQPRRRQVAALAVIVGFTLLGGHVQTSAHMLLALGAYAAWRWWSGPRGEPAPDHASDESADLTSHSLDPVDERPPSRWLRPACWISGIGLGVALAAVQVLPLGFYLSRSPVWSDRASARPSVLDLTPPRVLDAACTALPTLYGSQRRGQPNLAKAFGVHNLNESAGGFAGLATLLLLAPVAWSARGRMPRVWFLAGLGAFGFLGAFEVPPLANLLRALPVLDVMDHRRLTLWVAFSLVLLGGIGIDALCGRSVGGRRWAGWVGLWCVGALALIALATVVSRLGPILEARALEHYALAALETPGAEPEIFRERALRQVEATLEFVPRYLTIAAVQLAVLAALVAMLRRGRLGAARGLGPILAIVLLDLLGFAHGLNPAIDPDGDRPISAVIDYLKREVPPPARVLAIGSELPPNTIMRYGLADVRNYDSVEVARNLAYFEPLYQPGDGARTSRRTVTWDGVARALDRLRAVGVAAVVGATPPPPGLFDRVDQVGRVWIGRIEGGGGQKTATVTTWDHGRILVALRPDFRGAVTVPETFDPGWEATLDGRPVSVRPASGTFLGADIDSYGDQLEFRYNPPEVRVGLFVTSISAMAVVGLIAGGSRSKRPRKNAIGSWKAPRRRVTIVPVTSSRCSSPASLDRG